MSNDAPVLVTGAAGFIGSYLVEALLSRGQRVVGVDNFDPFYAVEAKRENVEAFRAHPRALRGALEFIEADICDAGAMRALMDRHRPEGVLHMAAKAGVRPSIADPVGYCRANVMGTAVLLEEARRAGVRRFVMASSSSVYGNNPKVPFAEDDDVSCPISPYAATKRACELMAHSHRHLTGMPTACLRFFTVYGPRQRPDLAIAMFLGKVSRGEALTLFGDGTTSRDYTFIDDIVRGVIAAYDRVERFGYRVWNLGGSDPVSLAEMVRTIGRVVGREPQVERRPMQPGDVERTFADLARSRSELDFSPTTRLEQGIARQWEWMKKSSKA